MVNLGLNSVKLAKDWFAWNNDNMSEGSDMSTHRLLFQWDITIKIQLSVSV
jgi:predicted GNAT superfamily acetyltransferase